MLHYTFISICICIYQRKASNDMRREQIIEYSSTSRRAGVDTTNPYKAIWKPDPAITVKDSYSISNWPGVLDGQGCPSIVFEMGIFCA